MIISRKEAKEKGLKRYFTGKPCKHGHICERYVNRGACIECNRGEKINEKRRNFRLLNRDRVLQQRNLHYYKNKEEISQKRKEKHIKEPWIMMFQKAKERAIGHNLPFLITINDIIKIYPKDDLCPVLGIVLKPSVNKHGPNSPTLDRIIPEIGYIPSNIVVMSHKANSLKRDETNPEIFRKIANWLEKQNVARNSKVSSNSFSSTVI